MSDSPMAPRGATKVLGLKPWQAATILASFGFFLVCLGFALPFSSFGVDPETKELKLGGSLENWRTHAGFLLTVIVCVFAGLALMIGSLQLVRDAERASQKVRWIVYGLNAVVSTVLLLIVLAVVNVLAFTEPIDQLAGRAFSRDYDWTKSTMYTLSPVTANTLDSLNEDIKAISFLQPEFPGYNEMLTLLRNAQARNKRFTWTAVGLGPEDRTRLRELMQKYLIKDPVGGVLLIAGDEKAKHEHEFIGPDKIARQEQDLNPMGGRRRGGKVTFTGENALLGAIASLTEGKVVIYVTQGHGEPALEGGFGAEAKSGSLAELKRRLTANRARLEVKPLTLDRATAKVPDDAAALLIVRPTLPFADAETKVLGEYLARKEERNADKTVKVAAGRMMALLEPATVKEAGGVKFQSTGLEGFLGTYGVSLPEERVQVLAGNEPLKVPVLVNPRSANPLNEAFNADGVTLFSMDGVRTVKPSEGKGGPYKADELLVGYPQAGVFLESDLGRDPVATANLLKNDERELGKRLQRKFVPVGLAVSETTGAPKMPGMPPDAAHGGGKERPLLVVVGSASWVMDSGLSGQAGNLRFDLFTSALSWLREQSEYGKRVDDKPQQDYELTVPAANTTRLYFMPLALMMLGVFALGTGVWVVRRR